MSKIILWAKRPVNMNLLLFVGISLIFLIFAVFSYSTCQKAEAALDGLGDWIDDTKGENVIDDVEGYGIIFGSVIYGLGSAGKFLLMLLTVYIPVALSLGTSLPAVLLRIIHSNKSDGRILCYRITTGILCASTVLALIVMTVISSLKASMEILMLLADALSVAAIVICIRNTYTDRIKQ